MVSKKQERGAAPSDDSFDARSGARKALDVAVVPLILGAITGATLHLPIAYWVLSILAAVAAVAVGMEHRRWQQAALRGLVAGFMFGLGIAIVYYAIRGGVEVRVSPEPSAGTPVVTAVLGALLTVVGTRLLGHRTAH